MKANEIICCIGVILLFLPSAIGMFWLIVSGFRDWWRGAKGAGLFLAFFLPMLTGAALVLCCCLSGPHRPEDIREREDVRGREWPDTIRPIEYYAPAPLK